MGRHLAPLALQQGLEVTALARSPNKIGLAHDRVTVVQGEIADVDAVARTIDGQDAVICLLGAPLMDNSGIRAAGTSRSAWPAPIRSCCTS